MWKTHGLSHIVTESTNGWFSTSTICYIMLHSSPYGIDIPISLGKTIVNHSYRWYQPFQSWVACGIVLPTVTVTH